MTKNYKCQSAVAVNSAVAKMFANVSVNEVAQKFTKKLIKTKNAQGLKGLKGLSASMEIKVSDDYRVKVDAFVYDNGEYDVNVWIEEKFGYRFRDFGGKLYDGKNINLISFSQIFADVEAAMYEIVDDVLYYNEKHGIEMSELPKKYNPYLNNWEELTGLDFAEVVMGADPMPESEESAEVTEEDVINEVVGVINANLIENYTEGQKLDWSLFNDSTMEYLFANGGPELYNKIIVRVAQISDCLAYDDCFYVWYMDVPAKNDAPKLETETAEDAPILAYEEVKFWAEQFDLYNLYMGEENRHVEYRCAVEDNWYEYLLRGWNIDVEHTKEYWDKFWKIYCNVMCDLWGEEYNIAVDNIHDQLIFTPMIDENDAPRLDGWVDGEWAWEDDGTKPKAPADPEMKEWLESLGCKFDEDDVYGVVEQLCTDMEEKMIECGDYMIGYKYAEPDFQGRPAEWFEDMIFVTKKSDLDEDGDYVWDDCEEFRIGDFDAIAEIKDAIVEYMGNNGDLTPALEEIEEIVDEVFDELNPNFDKWAAGEDVDSGFGDDYFVKNDAPTSENVRDYLNNDERAFFVLPDYDYVCGLFVEYNEDDDVYVAMGNESWNVTEYDGDTDMSVVIADFSNAWAKEIDEYCDFYKGLDYDRRIYRNDDYDAYMILLNSGVSHGLNVEEGYDPYKGDYVEVIA